jgi:hypothetical protein
MQEEMAVQEAVKEMESSRAVFRRNAGREWWDRHAAEDELAMDPRNPGTREKAWGETGLGRQTGVFEKIRVPNCGIAALPARCYRRRQLLAERLLQVTSFPAAALERVPGKLFGLANVIDCAGNQ